MSNTYPMYNYSSYPDEIDKFNRFTDLTLDTIEYAKQYNNYMAKSDLKNAAQVLINHPELDTSLINAANLNRIIDAIKCIETFYVEDVQKYLIEIIKFRSEYNSSTKYSKYDLVIYNDIGYLCISSTCPIGTLPTNENYFIALTLQGDQGVPGIGLNFSGSWSATIIYPKDSCVTYNNILYASVTDNNLGKTPGQNSSYWTLVFDISKLATYNNSSSNLNATTLQDAIDELNISINSNTNKLNTIENGAQKNTITGIKGSSESNYRTGNVNITPANLGITVVNNTADANKSVAYANSAGSANTATTANNCTGNSATATNANYATSAGNSDTVDGFHFQISTTDLEAGVSSLNTNIFYFVYE